MAQYLPLSQQWNSGCKRSLSEMEKTAAVNGSTNLGLFIKNRIGTPGADIVVGFMALDGFPFDEALLVDAVLSAVFQHIISSLFSLWDTKGVFHLDGQNFQYFANPGRMREPVIEIYISSGFPCLMGLAVYKYIVGHHGPGTRKVRFGLYNNSPLYAIFEQQAARLLPTSGSQWIFEKENTDFRMGRDGEMGRDLVHPDLYTELPPLALARQMANLAVAAQTVNAVGAAELMAQML
ncbi:MAG: hypothetical protein WDW36_000040 [Sanguina aurantia]